MKPWTRGRLPALLAVLALAVAACAAETTTTAGGEPGTTGATAADAGLPDLTGQSIEIAAVWSGAEQESFEQVLASFEEQTGADVSFISTGDDIATVLGTSIQGGDPPDVALLPQPGLLVDLAEQGNLVPIDDVAGDLVDANYAPVWRELGSVDGTLYGVWFKAANKSTVWYNAGVFTEAGVQPPETWEDFLAAARTLADFGITPISLGGADGWTLTDWFENVYLRTAGPDMYDQLTNHEIPWTDPSVTEALGVLADVFGDETLIGSVDVALQNGFVESVTRVFADDPGAAIVYEGDFVAGVVSSETNAVPGEDALFFPFPSIDGSVPSVVGGGDVAVLLDDTDGGRALIQYLASPQAAEIWAGLGGFASPNSGVDPAVYPDDITRAAAEELVSAEVFRFDLSDLEPAEFGGTVGQGMWGLLQDFLRNPDDIDGTAARLEEAAARAFG